MTSTPVLSSTTRRLRRSTWPTDRRHQRSTLPYLTLNQQPRTISVLNLAKIGDVTAALDSLASAASGSMGATQQAIAGARNAVQVFDASPVFHGDDADLLHLDVGGRIRGSASPGRAAARWGDRRQREGCGRSDLRHANPGRWQFRRPVTAPIGCSPARQRQ